MQIKRYRAENIQKAMQMIKDDLGNDAVIINSQKVKNDNKLLGWFGKPMIEVIAARDVDYHQADKPALKLPKRNPYIEIKDERTSIKEESEFERQFQDNLNESTASLTTKIINSAIAPLRDQIEDMKKELSFHQSKLTTETPSEPKQNQRNTKITSENEVLNKYSDLLKKQGVNEEVSSFLLNKISNNNSILLDSTEPKDIICSEIQSFVTVSPELKESRKKQKIIAFVGPTGVGKTTTCAKIAAKCSIENGLSVGFISLDNFRIGAVEQLQTYADLIHAPLEVAHTPQELTSHLKKFAKYDVVLIDTIGRSQREAGLINDLSAFLNNNKKIETHLVLSTTAREDILSEVIDNYAKVSIDKYIFTKLDETPSFGQILNILYKKQKPISFFTNGQRVPQDFFPATKESFRGLIFA